MNRCVECGEFTVFYQERGREGGNEGGRDGQMDGMDRMDGISGMES